MNNKYYYCTPSKKFDSFLCTIGWLAIQMALIITVSEMVGRAVGMFMINNKKDSPSEDEVCTSCADRFKEVRQ